MKEAFFIARKIQKSMGSKVIGPLLKLSIAATAMGMALVVLSITSGKGLQHAIMDKFRALEGDFTIQAYSLNRTEEWRPIALEDSLFTELAKAPYVDQIFPVVQKASLLVNPTEDVFEGVQIQGFTTDNFEYFQKSFTTDGTPIDGRYGCWISSNLASSLQLEIGDTAVLTVLKGQRGLPRLINTKIYGTYTSGLDEFDRQNVLMSAVDVRRLNGWNKDSVSAYVVHLNAPEQRATLSAYWNALVPYDLQVSALESRHPAIFGWLALFDTNIVLVLAIVLIVALSNLITALLVLIIDRTRMIGILKAMGAPDRMILQVFQWLSLNILVKGLLLGNAVGLGLSAMQQWFKWVQLDPSTYYIASAPIHFDWAWIIGANLGFILVAYLILLVPVRWIARLQPIQSIRFS